MKRSEESTTLNPFVAGYRRGKANIQQSKMEAAANPQSDAEMAQRTTHGLKTVVKLGVTLLAISFVYQLSTAPNEKDMTFEQLAQHLKFTAERECDRAAERHVKNRSSYASDSPTRTIKDGNHWIVTANFRAMNDFGAMLDHRFICRYNFTQKKVT
jgi:hypothetical protein